MGSHPWNSNSLYICSGSLRTDEGSHGPTWWTEFILPVPVAVLSLHDQIWIYRRIIWGNQLNCKINKLRGGPSSPLSKRRFPTIFFVKLNFFRGRVTLIICWSVKVIFLLQQTPHEKYVSYLFNSLSLCVLYFFEFTKSFFFYFSVHETTWDWFNVHLIWDNSNLPHCILDHNNNNLAQHCVWCHSGYFLWT